jgi:hypothetical protein
VQPVLTKLSGRLARYLQLYMGDMRETPGRESLVGWFGLRHG